MSLPNLLIVDDTEENLVFLETIIGKLDVNLLRAHSGAAALELSRGLEIALALIDVRMPEMDGYELAVKLNENRTVDKVPVIFLTANLPDEVEVSKGYRAGAVDYISKPVSRFILNSKIKSFLELFNQKELIRRDAELLRKSADVLTRVNTVIKKAEDKYRNYITHAPDGVFVTDEAGRYIEVNEAACLITGYSEDELLHMSIPDLLTDESVDEGLVQFARVNATGSASGDLMFRHKDGSHRWWTINAVKLDNTHFLGFAKDITDRRKAEEELKGSLEQLHRLTEYIQEVREVERVAISRELHDDLGQALTAVKIDLGMISQMVSEPETLARIQKTTSLVGETIKSVQRITAQLRPQILDDLGLEAAVEWYTEEFAQRTGIRVNLQADTGLAVSREASLIIFRIMQESLTNIARHSKADQVTVRLAGMGHLVNLRISDNGIGIIDQDIHSKKSFGIISMKERAASSGGTFEIFRDPGGGTVTDLHLPLNQSTADENSDLRRS